MGSTINRKVLMICVCIGIFAIISVVLKAHAAEVKVDNNNLIKEKTALQGEIDNLDIKIKSANSVENIEKVASSKLGMVYPEQDECVYISKEEAPKGNLAMIIKGNAYN